MKTEEFYEEPRITRPCDRWPCATRCFKGGGGAAATRDLYSETSGELQAKLDLAPSVLAAEQQYQPQYSALELQSLQDMLFGTQGGARTVNRTVNDATPAGWYDRSGNLVSADANYRGAGAKAGADLGYEWRNATTTPRTISETVQMQATPGVLAMSKDIGAASDEMEAASQSRLRAQEVTDLETLGPRSLAAMRTADPTQAELVDTLSEQSLRDLMAGSTLRTPELRQAQQTLRSRRTGTLGGTGTAGDYNEVLGISQFGQALKAQRQASAASAIGLRDATYGSALSRVLGRTAGTGTGNYLNTAARMSSSLGSKLFGSSINANDVYDTNVNAQNAAKISAANNSAATSGAAISGVSSVLGAGAIALAL